MLSPAQKRLCCSLFWKHVLQVRSPPSFCLYMVENIRLYLLLSYTYWNFQHIPSYTARNLEQRRTVSKMAPPRVPTDTLLEMCYQKIHESNRVSSTSSKYQTSTNNSPSHQDLENHTAKVKNENLKLERAIQQMQATIPRSREVDPANARRLHENAIQVVQQTLRNTSERLADLRSGMYNRDYDTRRLVRRVVDRLSGQVPAWSRHS